MYYDIKNLNIWKEDSMSMRQMTGNRVKEISDNGIVYPFYLGKQFVETEVENLNLTIRSYNCIRRRGWCTVGDIIQDINSKQDLMAIRNLGKNSAEEIFNELVDYHFSLLTYGEQSIYQKKYDEANNIPVSVCTKKEIPLLDFCYREKLMVMSI